MKSSYIDKETINHAKKGTTKLESLLDYTSDRGLKTKVHTNIKKEVIQKQMTHSKEKGTWDLNKEFSKEDKVAKIVQKCQDICSSP